MSRPSSVVTRSARDKFDSAEPVSRSLRSRTISGGVVNRSLSASSTPSMSRKQRSSAGGVSATMIQQTSNDNIRQQQQQATPMASSHPTVGINDVDMELTDEETDDQTNDQRKKLKSNMPPVRHLFKEEAPGVFTCLVQVLGKPCGKVRNCFACFRSHIHYKYQLSIITYLYAHVRNFNSLRAERKKYRYVCILHLVCSCAK